MSDKMSIVFFGENIIATTVIKFLYNDFKIAHLFTTEEPVKRSRSKFTGLISKFAEANNIPYTVVKNITPEVKKTVAQLSPDLIIVVSFGVFLPNSLLDKSKLPPINLHPSALPKYRGAAPIARAIENGDKEIGICVIEVINKMDAGDIFAQRTLNVQNMSSTQVYQKVGQIGGEMLSQVAKQLQNNNAERKQQDDKEHTMANKITKEELLLNFNNEPNTLVNKIRAFDIFGGCYFNIKNNSRVKILQADALTMKDINNNDATKTSQTNGTINAKMGIIFCKNGAIKPIILQKEGKEKMLAKDFWNGYKR
ncbi:MAG: methionyl-tRNA formyltransferase [Alphaproteobacteria bacterium]|nr:methionyl-tRNA formyltransferase [Rickettsiales bacterium]